MRSELLNKNKIIELLITNTGHNFGIEKQSTTLKANDLNHNKTYNKTRNKDNKTNEADLNLNLFPTKNRFDSLNDETSDINITQNIPMKKRDELNVSVESCTKSNLNICAIGDSIIKEIKPYKMHQAFKSKKNRIFVKSFPGATTLCMNDYVTPSMKHKPDVMILHSGANDLRSEKTPKDIVEEITNLAEKMKTTENDIVISGLIVRNDSLNDKGTQVNELLKLKCTKLNIPFINNENINKQHLNKSGLHLNLKGTTTLANNYIKFLKL